MNELWNSRTKQYQKMIMRYLKYVLNDHLVLALLFFGGGIGLAYSNWLKEIHPGTLVYQTFSFNWRRFANFTR